MDLTSSFNQILQVGAGKEVSQVNELAVVFVLDVDDTPTVLPATDLFAIDNDIFLTADYSKRNDILFTY